MTPTDLPALRVAVAKMQLDYPVVYDAAEMRDGLGFVIVDADDGIQHEAYGEGIATLLNAALALLDELEAARARQAERRATCRELFKGGFDVDDDENILWASAQRVLAELAAARAVLDGRVDLGEMVNVTITPDDDEVLLCVSRAAWLAWQARGGKEQG
jgi:hypothetical protein